MLKPYVFVSHDVGNEPPANSDFDLVASGAKLSREVKDRIFHKIVAQSRHGQYKLMGWIFPYWQFMKRYWVRQEHSGITEVWAFDKMCIRNSFYTNSPKILEIVEVPPKEGY